MPEALAFPPRDKTARNLNSGCYRYLNNDQLVPIAESWNRASVFPNEILTYSNRRVAEPDITMQVQTRHRNDRLLEAWFEFCGSTRVRAHYWVTGEDKMKLQHQVGDCEITAETVDTSDYDLLFPLLRVYTGSLLHHLLTAGEIRGVLVPRIDCIDDPEQLFKPAASKRWVEKLDSGILKVDEQEIHCEELLFHGGPYAEGARCWVAGDTLLRYDWQQATDSHWRVELHDLCIA